MLCSRSSAAYADCSRAILSSASSSSPATTCCAAFGTNGSAAELRIKTRSSMASCTVLSSKEEWSIDMALYIDSAFLHDIMNVAQTVPVAGVTTNPSILLAARERGQDLNPQGVLDVLLRSVAGTIFMQPGASDEEGMHAEALAYIQTAPDRVIPKIPMTQTGSRVDRRPKALQHPIQFTAVTSVAQAYSGALAAADFVITKYERMDNLGMDAITCIRAV